MDLHLKFASLVARDSATSTSSAPSAAPTPSDSGGTTPSLFFIALGVGVVFTNLWLIIAIKFCCRRRQARFNQMHSDDEEANEELRTLHFYTDRYGRFRSMPRRRRQKKKLLTLEQLDEQSAVQKYKEWCAHREQNGLPTAGGISSEAAQALATEIPRMNEEKALESIPCNSNEITQPNQNKSTSKIASSDTKSPDQETTNSTDVKQSDQPDHACEKSHDASVSNHTELEETPSFQTGDLCAICIDNLEPEDDIRALPCHHVFHADCITPWLTTRRAICPLCKKDLFVSRSENAEIESPISVPPPAAGSSHAEDTDQIYPWEVIVRSPRANRTTMAGVGESHTFWPFNRSNDPASTETLPTNTPVQTTQEITTQESRPSRLWFWRRNPNHESSNV